MPHERSFVIVTPTLFPFYKRNHELNCVLICLYYKAREAGEMEERADESEISRLNKTKSMDPEKYAFVQKYLQDVQDTRSITTEASDSGLATHAAASELGNEEINGKYRYLCSISVCPHLI